MRLTGEERKRLTKRPTENTQAFQAYLKGRYYWNRRTEEGLQKGVQYFQEAIESDPNYALAYAGLADSYDLLPRYGFVAPEEGFPKGKAAAMKALEIDDTLAEAHSSLGYAQFFHDWDWVSGEKEFKRALELNPGYATAHHWYSLYLRASGRLEEAVSEIKRAQELDPLSLIINSNVGLVLYHSRSYDQAIEQFHKTIELDPNFASVHIRLGKAYEQKQMYAQAIDEFRRAGTLFTSSEITGSLGHAYALSGNKDEALKLLGELKELSKHRYVSSYYLALIYIGLGEKDRAFESLETAYAERSDLWVFVKVDPELDPLRSDPRYQDLVRRIGVP